MKYISSAIIILALPYSIMAMDQIPKNLDDDNDQFYLENPPPFHESHIQALLDETPSKPGTNRGMSKKIIQAFYSSSDKKPQDLLFAEMNNLHKLLTLCCEIQKNHGLTINTMQQTLNTVAEEQKTIISNQVLSAADLVEINNLQDAVTTFLAELSEKITKQSEFLEKNNTIVLKQKHTNNAQILNPHSKHLKNIEGQIGELEKKVTDTIVSLLPWIQDHQTSLNDIKKILQVQGCDQRCEMVGIGSFMAFIAAILIYSYSTVPSISLSL